jgi:GWxTD domain-containing protein
MSRVNMDPDSRAFYEKARLIMTQQEKNIFTHLPDDNSRREFIQDFWEKRDTDPDTEFNEFREEFYRRIEYANERFKEGIPGWKTDRGRIYIYFGEPDSVDLRPMVRDPSLQGFHGYIFWKYYRYGFAVMFVDKRGDNSYTFDPSVGTFGAGGGIVGDFFDALERVRFGLPPRTVGFDKKFLDFDVKFVRETKEFELSIPAETVTFVSEDGKLKADFDFEFFFYRKKGTGKQSFSESRHFEKTERETARLKHIEFTFTFSGLKPGKYFVDVVVTGKPDIGKARKIFNVKY